MELQLRKQCLFSIKTYRCCFCGDDPELFAYNGRVRVFLCNKCSVSDEALHMLEMWENNIVIMFVRETGNYLTEGGVGAMAVIPPNKEVKYRVVDYKCLRDKFSIPYHTFGEFDKACPLNKIYVRTRQGLSTEYVGGC